MERRVRLQPLRPSARPRRSATVVSEQHASVLVRQTARYINGVLLAGASTPDALQLRGRQDAVPTAVLVDPELRYRMLVVLEAAVESFDATLQFKYAGLASKPLLRLASTRRLALDLELRVHAELATLAIADQHTNTDQALGRERVMAARALEESELATQSSRTLADAARTALRRYAATLLEGIAMLRFELAYHSADHSQQHRETMGLVLASIEDARLFGNEAAALRPLLRHDLLDGFIPRYSMELGGCDLYGTLRHGTLLETTRSLGPGTRIIVTKPFALSSMAALPQVIDVIARWSTLQHDNVAKCVGFTFWNRDEPFTPHPDSEVGHQDGVSVEWSGDGLLVATIWADDGSGTTPICFGAPMGVRDTFATLHQVALAVTFLHREGRVRHNVCCENIAISSDGRVRLANFRLGLPIDLQALQSTEEIDRMSAPEVILGGDGDHDGGSLAAAIYSLAMCAVVMLTGELPFDTKSDQEVVAALLGPRPIPRPHTISQGLWRVLSPLLATDPTLRPGINAVVRTFEAIARAAA